MGKKGAWFSAVKKAFSKDSSSDDHLQDTPAHFLSSKDGNQEITALPEKKKAFKERNRWSFRRSSRALQPADQLTFQPGNDLGHLDQVSNPNKHALAVAVATAAAAEAAVAAAQAAAQVAKLTGTVRSRRNEINNTPRSSNFAWRGREELAAIRIQTAFRAFLARRTLRALKGLARLQALAQGRVGQRQISATMQCMQALVRAQVAVRGRSTTQDFEDDPAGAASLLHPSCEQWEHRQSPGVSTKQLDNNVNQYRNKASTTPQLGWNWLERWMAARPWENRRASPAKGVSTPRGFSTPVTPAVISTLPQRQPSPLRRGSAPPTPGAPSFRQPSTPRTAGPARRAAAVTPVLSGFPAPSARLTSVPASVHTRAHSLASSSMRDDLSVASFLGTPNYMSSTESTRAKLRSHSTPKQRPSGTSSSVASIHSEDMYAAQQPVARKRLSFTYANADTGSAPARSFMSWRRASAPLQRNFSFEGRYTKANL